MTSCWKKLDSVLSGESPKPWRSCCCMSVGVAFFVAQLLSLAVIGHAIPRHIYVIAHKNEFPTHEFIGQIVNLTRHTFFCIVASLGLAVAINGRCAAQMAVGLAKLQYILQKTYFYIFLIVEPISICVLIVPFYVAAPSLNVWRHAVELTITFFGLYVGCGFWVYMLTNLARSMYLIGLAGGSGFQKTSIEDLEKESEYQALKAQFAADNAHQDAATVQAAETVQPLLGNSPPRHDSPV